MTKVEFRNIDATNFRQVLDLQVTEGQRNFVAPNVRSIAECVPYPHLVPNAIFSGNDVVGFALYGRDLDTGAYWIVRLMIDAAHQSKGFGKAATRTLIDKMKAQPGCTEIYLSFVPGNSPAEGLYRSVGFEPTGEVNESGEIIMRYAVPKASAQS